MRQPLIALAVALSAAALCLLAQPGSAWAQDQTVVVSIDGVIFEEPDDSSRVILRVEAGERLQVIAQKGDWVQVQLPRGKGWVMRRLVKGLSDSPNLAGVSGSDERVTVVDEFADVRQGPGEAYLGITRIFRGDSFSVAKRSDDGEWVQIRVDGDLGWVRADQVIEAKAVAPPLNGGGNSGQGGNQGNGGGNNGDLGGGGNNDGGGGLGVGGDLGGGEGGESSISLELNVGGNFQLASQSFTSDTPSNPFLQLYNVDSSLFGPSVSARAWLFDYIGVGADYQFGFGTPIEAQLEADQQALELSNQTHRVQATLTGRFPFTAGPRPTWAGVTAGLTFHQFNIQAVQQQADTAPVFLTNTYTGLRLVAEGSVAIGPLDVFAGGGLVLLGGLDQGQFDSGAENGTTFITAEGGVSFEFMDGFALFLKGSFDSYETNFAGESTRQPDISLANNKDEFILISSGLTWRPL